MNEKERARSPQCGDEGENIEEQMVDTFGSGPARTNRSEKMARKVDNLPGCVLLSLS